MRRFKCPWGRPSFGLTPEDKTIFLEHCFLLMYYGGFTYTDVYSLPIRYREWFIVRINKEFESSNKQQSRGAHQNTPDARAMQGMARTESPSRLRRFT